MVVLTVTVKVVRNWILDMILKVEPRRYADALGMACERKKNQDNTTL